MGEFAVAIPSYRRATLLPKRTLAVLESLGVPAADITIFVADTDEAQEYETTLAGNGYGRLVVGVRGLVAQRNFIQGYYPEGAPLLFLDDDVEALLFKRSDKLAVPCNEAIDFPSFVNEAFATAKRAGIGLWGVYPVANPFYMGDGAVIGLYYVVGACDGMWNSHDPAIKLRHDDYSEDRERTLRFYKRDGAVLRFDNICVKAKYWKQPGGLQADGRRTPEAVMATMQKVAADFPGLAVAYVRRNGWPDLRFAPNPRRKC
jgi:hypothetical protein